MVKKRTYTTISAPHRDTAPPSRPSSLTHTPNDQAISSHVALPETRIGEDNKSIHQPVDSLSDTPKIPIDDPTTPQMTETANQQLTGESDRFQLPPIGTVFYARHFMPYQAAIPYDTREVSNLDVKAAIVSHWKIDMYTLERQSIMLEKQGIVYVSFPHKQAYDHAYTHPLIFKKGILQAYPLKSTTGHPLTISADNVPMMPLDEIRTFCESLFYVDKDKGYKMLSFARPSVTEVIGASGNTGVTFVLEIPSGAIKTSIPRAAALLGSNVVFSWPGVDFCDKCCSAAHTRATCNPATSDIRDMLPLSTPILAQPFCGKYPGKYGGEYYTGTTSFFRSVRK